MRRYWREGPPKSMFRGAELPRLMTGLLMLAVIWMLIVRAREPSTWRWLAQDEASVRSEPEDAQAGGPPPEKRPAVAVAPADKPAQDASRPSRKSPEVKATSSDAKRPSPPNSHSIDEAADHAKTSKKPDVTGKDASAKDSNATPPDDTLPELTDQDPEQMREARNEFLAITDGTTRLGPEEMEAYDRIIEWVRNQSFAALEKRAKKGLRYTHFVDDADKRRGELVALNVEIRLSDKAGKNRYGVPLYDAWADTEESRGRLYSLILLDYPKGMPLVDVMRGRSQKARFVGYFLKLQGYQPGLAKPGAPPELAPLLIGRIEWIPPVEVTPVTDSRTEWLWGLAILAFLAVVFVLRTVYYKITAQQRQASVTPGRWAKTPREAVPVETWLEQAEFTDETDDFSHHSVEIEPDRTWHDPTKE